MNEEEKAMLEDIKVLLSIQDSIQDRVLNILMRNTKKHLSILLKRVNHAIEEVPNELNFVIEEIVIRRYNRLGSEGMDSESVEGHSITFANWREDFQPYAEIIETYRKKDDGTGRGKVIFI